MYYIKAISQNSAFKSKEISSISPWRNNDFQNHKSILSSWFQNRLLELELKRTGRWQKKNGDVFPTSHRRIKKCGIFISFCTRHITMKVPPSVSRLSRKCGNLNISQPYGPLRPVTGIGFFLSTQDGISHNLVQHLNSRNNFLRWLKCYVDNELWIGLR
jgi:hypothetical protein